MALDVEQVEALLEKSRALGARERKCVDELEAHNERMVFSLMTPLNVTCAAYGTGYLRGYLGDKATVGAFRSMRVWDCC